MADIQRQLNKKGKAKEIPMDVDNSENDNPKASSSKRRSRRIEESHNDQVRLDRLSLSIS